MKWKKNRYLYLTLIFAFSFFYSCEKETIKPIKVETVSFKNDIIPIFTSKCVECHAGSRNPDLRAANAYVSLKKGGYYDTIVPTQSIIYKQLTTNTSHVQTSKVSDLDVQKILLWITKGAKNE
jgi:hypothetical protein